ncbi:fumarylacetoacetate hydrolase family protein [Elongatibacter sediminis]|uniref:Fumarylacetoacetate hydrolase family protein n=1 Tax=Elongatibacter sediminis TaxID=3119006 RepID=A0AAW9RFQ1_9GAMM
MKLVTYSNGAEPRVGFLVGEQVCDLNQAAKAKNVALPSVTDLQSLARVEHLAALRDLSSAVGDQPDSDWSHPIRDVTLHAPYRPRQNITVAGGNTRDDFVAERSPKGRPMLRYHTKAPSATVDPGQPISWPRQLATQVHAEPNIAVVMGARSSYVEPADVLDNVFGYTVATNVISSDLKRKHGQWDKAVSLDTFFPWGPVLVTADEAEPEDLACRLWLNDGMALSGGAESGLLGTAAILSEISFGMTLEPGDVILTCTAEGVGHGEQPERWLQDGDVVRSGIAGICEIENPVSTY